MLETVTNTSMFPVPPSIYRARPSQDAESGWPRFEASIHSLVERALEALRHPTDALRQHLHDLEHALHMRHLGEHDHRGFLAEFPEYSGKLEVLTCERGLLLGQLKQWLRHLIGEEEPECTEELRSLLVRIRANDEAESDLVHEAYWRDIGVAG